MFRAACLLALCLFAELALAIEFPALTGRVVDQANLLSPGTRAQLTERLAQHERETSNQVVIVTLNSLQGVPIEDYGYQLGRTWGIGQEKRNNGVLLIVAPNERKVRIEVGYGLEGALTDAQSHLIIQNVILPRFREGRFEPGIVEGTDAILGTLAGTYKPVEKKRHSSSDLELALMLGVAWFFIGQGFVRSVRPRVIGAGLIGTGTVGITWYMLHSVVPAVIAGVVAFVLHLILGGGWGGNYRSGGYGGGGWGGGGGGGFSGGGGSFGGGGSSGSW